MNKIQNFEKMFSSEKVLAMKEMVISRSGNGIKTNNALDYLSVAYGYNDYKTASGLWEYYKKKSLNTWIPKEQEDEIGDLNFSLFKIMNKLEKKHFLEKHGEKIEISFCYAYDEESYEDLYVLTEGCLTKQAVIDLVESRGGVFFFYEATSDSGGNPEFTILMDKDVKKIEDFICELYKVEDKEEYRANYDFPNIKSARTAAQIINNKYYNK